MVASLRNVNARNVIIGPVIAPPPSYDYFLDTFDGTSDLSAHTANTGESYYGDQAPSTLVASGAFTVSGGNLLKEDDFSSNGYSVGVAVANPPINDFFIEITSTFNADVVPPGWPAGSGSGIYLLDDFFGAFQGCSLSLSYGFPYPSPSRYFISMWVNTPSNPGVTTQIDPATYTPGDSYLLRINVTNAGQTVTWFFNNTQIGTTTSDFPFFEQYWLEQFATFTPSTPLDVTISQWRTGPLPWTP